ncbi:DUF2065 domain-containing protein [Alteromonas sp. a30]|uniref:DUF2065 domain-containing protein n=1 Tax=Alteromonas sp. a30 TaxID=2730917 RepID=UPI00227E4E35|nr:DUF2065 family protein [Alteromonas sp. a30]MCY7294725.1 DUF2065 family protein [Alteromonas sp. a30]
MWETIWTALALVLVIEGIGPMLFPNRWRHYISSLGQVPISQLRQLGGILVLIGGILLFFRLT